MMRKAIALFLALCCCIPASAAAQTNDNGVLVVYADGTTDVFATEKAAARAENALLLQPNYTYTASGLSVSDTLSAQQWALSNDGSFTMQEQKNRYPVYEKPFEKPSAPGKWLRPFAASDSSAVTATAGVDIGVTDAWNAYDGGTRDTVIALIDTGVDFSHPELADALWVNTDEIAGNGIDDDGNGYIDDVNGWNFYDNNNSIYTNASDDAHGTHGAGTIAARADNGVGIAGIVNSDHVKIMVLKALGGSDGSGTTAALIRAIQYAEANGADIVNLSLGSSSADAALYRTIQNSNMLFVCAAGNDGANTDASPSYPASFALDNILSVANLMPDGTLAQSSNYGKASVDLAAPGSYILSTAPNGRYSYMSGTSMAAPMVTASAAMLYSAYPDLTLAQVKALLLATARPLATLTDKTLSGGMLDLGAAMAYDISSLAQANNSASVASTAPVLSAQTFRWNGQAYLRLTVTDAENDVVSVKYARGTKTAADFAKSGTAASLTDGSVLFRLYSSGSISFYAVDSAGNEAVKSVTVQIPFYTPFRK